MATSTLIVSSLDKEYIRVPISAREAGVLVNPTSNTVDMAFVSSGEPASGDWKTASWETDSTGAVPVYYARILIGPGSTVVLADGVYGIWVRINGSPEVPVKHCGYLDVT